MMRRAGLLLALLWLGSCGTSAPVPEDHYYRLVLGAAPAEQRLTTAPLTVTGFTAEGLYHDRALLYSNDPEHRQLQQHHYYYWYTSPPRLLREYLVQYLRHARVASTVLDDSGTGGSFSVTGKVLHFERHAAAPAAVEVMLELQLMHPDRALPLILKQYHARVEVQGQDMGAIVAAFNTAVDGIYGEFVQDMAAALAAP